MCQVRAYCVPEAASLPQPLVRPAQPRPAAGSMLLVYHDHSCPRRALPEGGATRFDKSTLIDLAGASGGRCRDSGLQVAHLNTLKVPASRRGGQPTDFPVPIFIQGGAPFLNDHRHLRGNGLPGIEQEPASLSSMAADGLVRSACLLRIALPHPVAPSSTADRPSQHDRTPGPDAPAAFDSPGGGTVPRITHGRFVAAADANGLGGARAGWQ